MGITPEFMILRGDEENMTGLGVLRQCIFIDTQIAPGTGYKPEESTLIGSQTAFCTILNKEVEIVDEACQKSQCPHNDIPRRPSTPLYQSLMGE